MQYWLFSFPSTYVFHRASFCHFPILSQTQIIRLQTWAGPDTQGLSQDLLSWGNCHSKLNEYL